ncbi:MAG: sensor histidine kinase [Gaiellaceae bacterium]
MKLADFIGYVNVLAYGTLAGVAARQWRMRRDGTAVWAALGFGALGLVVVLGQILPEHPHGFLQSAVQRLDIALLLAFPYLLYRFTTAFRVTTRRLEWAIGLLTLALIAWTFALPSIPESGEPRPSWFFVYLVAFLAHWTLLSVLVAVRLWWAATQAPLVAQRRMRLLASASAALTLALFVAAANNDADPGLDAAAGALATLSAVGFLLGLAPPAWVRVLWRMPAQEQLQRTIQNLVALARSPSEVVGRVLPSMADMVGARGVAYVEPTGRVVGAHNVDTDVAARAARGEEVDLWRDARLERVEVQGATVLLWTSPYSPFFGTDELQLLRTVATLTGLAIDRVRLFEHEHAARLALEQANELKTNFVALAAHELRTPVTTIHGFASTLHRLADRLDADQRAELRAALAREAARMASLVEQLLDLSRLDAAAIEIVPQRFAVRDRLTDIVRTAAGERASEVEIDVPAALTVSADVDAFERIVTNLVTNALRHGAAPVVIEAEQSDRHFRLAVADHGDGVAAEFLPRLFERFARSDDSRGRSQGTGLGLAIARSYARAHNGDLLYEPGTPRGASFQLVLPSAAGSL